MTTLATGAKQRLLIVDDHSANIRVMAEALHEAYELYFATSGAKALEILGARGRDRTHPRTPADQESFRKPRRVNRFGQLGAAHRQGFGLQSQFVLLLIS